MIYLVGGIEMVSKKNIIIGFIVFLLFASTFLIIYEKRSPQRALNNFSKLIESENFDDLSLTIYYSNAFTMLPLSVEDLKSHRSTVKVTVNGDQLAEHIDLLKTISNVDLIPVRKKSRIDARVYYVFENKGRKILDVAMWGDGDDDDSIYVNGKEFKENDILINALRTFR
ncbi:hypothetical protein RBH29_03665 [Herbivorax sp. ANBcel31]|uniref:hypothetical protein n=1 Tax=Herbivorax sp. ANBcel31 TaxID=3069754 RepID=UPI0027B4634D|nr:hypothetical protein [Herbivorax sp. ANBcel31]MDQ2085530.1 hypothetical protein [Herbivorax sp. ANBcel31]